MAINLITGTPGGGKSYLAVESVVDKYFKFNKDSGEWEKLSPVTIITNIEELQLDHISLDDEIEKRLQSLLDKEFEDNPLQTEQREDKYYEMKVEKVRYFFNYEYQEILREKYGSILYLIDECQEYFDNKFGRKKWARGVFLFFEKHRHLGMDIYLITQASSKLAMDIRTLAERETRALPRSLSIAGELKYNEYIRGMKSNGIPQVKRPRQVIFDLYKSMEQAETEKVKSPLKRFMVIGALCVCIGFSVIYFRFVRRADAMQAESLAKQPAKVESVVGQQIATATPPPKIYTRWIRLDYVRLAEQIKIFDPVYRELVDIKSTQGRYYRMVGTALYCKLDSEEYELYKDRRAQELERTDVSRKLLSTGGLN